MSHYEEPYPFENEPHHTERQYLRNWKEMPSRFIWNSHPMRTHEKECRSCGYRYPEPEFKQFPDQDGRCWNCWMCETQPYEVKKIWERVDRNNVPPPKDRIPPNPKIVKFGDGQ